MVVQDAPEMIERFLATEQDVSSRRNAFMTLAAHAQDRAVRYLYEHVDQITGWGDIMQMAVLELIRKVGLVGSVPWLAVPWLCVGI